MKIYFASYVFVNHLVIMSEICIKSVIFSDFNLFY